MLFPTKLKNILLRPNQFYEDLIYEEGILYASSYFAVLYALSCIVVGSGLLPELSRISDTQILTNLFLAYTSYFVELIILNCFIGGIIYACIRITSREGTYAQAYQVWTYSFSPFILYCLAEVAFNTAQATIPTTLFESLTLIYIVVLLSIGFQKVYNFRKFKALALGLLAVAVMTIGYSFLPNLITTISSVESNASLNIQSTINHISAPAQKFIDECNTLCEIKFYSDYCTTTMKKETGSADWNGDGVPGRLIQEEKYSLWSFCEDRVYCFLVFPCPSLNANAKEGCRAYMCNESMLKYNSLDIAIQKMKEIYKASDNLTECHSGEDSNETKTYFTDLVSDDNWLHSGFENIGWCLNQNNPEASQKI